MNTNDDLKVKKLVNSQVSFEVIVDKTQLVKARKTALEVLGENMEIGGFRKGKAPASVVEKNVDKGKLFYEIVDIAIKESYYDFVMKNKDSFITIGQPDIQFTDKMEEKSLVDGFKYNVTVDVYPDIKLPDITKLNVKKNVADVSEDDLKIAIDDILKKRSKLMPHEENRKIEKGDWVDINFEVTVDGKVEKDMGSKDFPLVVGNNAMISGFEDELIGMKKSETKKFSLDIEQDFRDKRMAGKNVQFEVLVNDIKMLVPPVLDDSLVESLKIDDVKTVSKFKEYLLDSLRKEKETENIEKTKNDIINIIDQNTEFEIPKSLIDRELHVMWHEFEDNIKRRGIDVQDYMQKEGLDEQKIKTGWTDQAKKRTKIGLLVGELVKSFAITIDKNDLSKYIEQELLKIKTSLEMNYPDNWQDMYNGYKEEFGHDEQKKYFEQQMIVNKLFDILNEKMVS